MRGFMVRRFAFIVSLLVTISLGVTTAHAQSTEAASSATAQHEADANGYIVRDGEMAPDFTVTLTDGRKVTLSQLRGKVVLLQFTASWCGVCRKEMPSLESEIWQKHKDNPNFVFIGIDRDEPLDKVKRFAVRTGVTYPLGLDPNADIFGLYALKEAGVTRNVLIGRDGKIVKRTRLYDAEEFSSLVKAVDALLDTAQHDGL